MKVVCSTLKIIAPNVRWNTYERVRETSFWGKETYYIRVKDKSGEYAREEHKVVGDEWRILEYEIGVINWFLKGMISRSDLETIKSPNFIELCKEYQNKDSISVNMMLWNPNATQMLIKKRWALELWKDYQYHYHLNGVRTFKISNGKTKEYHQVLDHIGEMKINGRWYDSKEVEASFWKWPEEFKLLY